MIDDNPCDQQLKSANSAIAARDVLEQLRIEERARRKRLEALVDKLVESLREIKRHETECLEYSCGYDGMVDGVAEDALALAEKMKEANNGKG